MLATHSMTASSKAADIECRFERLTDERILVVVDQTAPGKLRKRTSLFLSETQLGVLLKGGAEFFANEEQFKLPVPIDAQI